LNSVLDLVFLCSDSSKHDHHHIYPDWRLTLDYVPITIDISIIEEHIQTKRQSLIKNNKEESHFIKELVCSIKSINTDAIQSIDALKSTIQTFSSNINKIWHKHSKVANITKVAHSFNTLVILLLYMLELLEPL